MGRLLRWLPICAVALTMTLSSCDSVIYDEEGDCDPYYKVRFVFNHHLKYGDAFPYVVGEVTLYIVDDETGKVVKEIYDNSEAVSEPGYLMEIDRNDVVPGHSYSLIAWCGEGHRKEFTVNEEMGDMRGHLHCRLTATDAVETGENHVSTRVGHLYHGKLVAAEFPDEQGVHIFTVPLIKDTNDVHIVLQHMSGKPVEPDEFNFSITSDNAHLDWDNTVLPGYEMNYHEWWKSSVSAGVEKPDGSISFPDTKGSRALTQTSAVVADLRTSRLMKDDKARVTITRKDGSTVASIPLVDYCLMMKGEYRGMNDQEYLDRKDDYSMVFFLDESYNWMNAYIYVESWKVQIQEVSL